MAGDYSGSDLKQFFGCRRQHVAAGRGDHDRIFDPDTAYTFEVNAWLDGNGHARLERQLLFLAQARGLVNLQSETMAGGVNESVVQPRGLKHLARGPIHGS